MATWKISISRIAERLIILLLVCALYVPASVPFAQGPENGTLVLCTSDGFKVTPFPGSHRLPSKKGAPDMPERCPACLTCCGASSGVAPPCDMGTATISTLAKVVAVCAPWPEPTIRRICPRQPSRAPPPAFV